MELFQDMYKSTMTWQVFLELVVFITGIWSVWYAKKEHIAVYPTGLMATIISTYLLWQAAYYGDMIVNLYFSVMSIYGWYKWHQKLDGGHSISISRTNAKERMLAFLLFLITIGFVYGIYIIFTPKIAPEQYIDMLTAGIFFSGMWLMALKKIENWILWIIGDLLVVPIYFYRGLEMLAIQYIIFTLLAIIAYKEWKKILNK